MRADLYIFTQGHTKSRQASKALIEEGNVLIDGIRISKPSLNVDETLTHIVEILNKPRFVSRGGEKLEGALASFGIDVKGKNCIDIGASTGGFTDCLIIHGAKCVYAIDSGHSQLDPKLAEDPRVVSIEKYNARYLTPQDFPFSFDIAVMDVSFISQTLIHKGIEEILREDGLLVTLIKPQFECGKNALNSNGIIKKAAFHIQAINRIIDSALISGFSCLDIMRSPIEGGDGNVEFLALLQKASTPHNFITDNKIKTIVSQK